MNKEGLENIHPLIKESDVLLPVDLSNASEMIPIVERTIREVGSIDGMALVAGMLNTSLLKFVKEELWEKIEKVNLYYTIELSKLFSKKGIRPTGVGGQLLQYLPIAGRWEQ